MRRCRIRGRSPPAAVIPRPTRRSGREGRGSSGSLRPSVKNDPCGRCRGTGPVADLHAQEGGFLLTGCRPASAGRSLRRWAAWPLAGAALKAQLAATVALARHAVAVGGIWSVLYSMCAGLPLHWSNSCDAWPLAWGGQADRRRTNDAVVGVVVAVDRGLLAEQDRRPGGGGSLRLASEAVAFGDVDDVAHGGGGVGDEHRCTVRRAMT